MKLLLKILFLAVLFITMAPVAIHAQDTTDLQRVIQRKIEYAIKNKGKISPEIEEEIEKEIEKVKSKAHSNNYTSRENLVGNLNVKSAVERILSYNVDIIVDTNSTLTITEKIKVNALGQSIQRGIFRSLPLKRNVNNNVLFVKYKVLSVKKNGVEEPYHTTNNLDDTKIYIGDEDVWLTPDVYEYEIKYETYRQIGYFENFDELYWNVCGTEWAFSIDTINATVHLPEGAEILQNACYTGALGSTEKDCSSTILSPHTIKWQAAGLGAYEGLTIAVGFAKGVVKAPAPPVYLEKNNLSKILYGAGALLLSFMVFLWSRYGRDPQKPVVIPQFSVPNDLSPAAMGYIVNKRYSSKLIAASLINMAVKGGIEITESKKGLFNKKIYTIKKQTQPRKEPLSSEESLLMNRLLYGNREVSFDGQYDSQIAAAVENFKRSIEGKNRAMVHSGTNRSKAIIPWLIITVIYGAILYTAYTYTYDFEKLITGIVLYVIEFILFVIYLGSKPFRPLLAKWYWIVPALLAGLYYKYFYTGTMDSFNMAYAFLFISFVALVIFSYLITQPRKDFLELESQIEGFKMYMGAAENQLIQFHNPPKMTPEIFEKYLPYAIVLGVGGVWGKRFEKTLEQNAIQYESPWYHGGSVGGFSAGMSSSLANSLSSSISSSATQPSSSGSSGGGSSGGGGGGGGGGGW